MENIYISPLELCNLNCQYCYTKKTKNILSNRQILSFVRRYSKFLKKFRSQQFFNDIQRGNALAGDKKFVDEKLSLKSIIFCGGEVFTLKNFPRLINKLNSMGIFVSVITNGTIDKLDKIKDSRNCQLIVSFDGPEAIHDANRGSGNFAKSKNFVQHALKLDFPMEIFYLITKDSYPYKDSLDIFGLHKTYLTDRLGSLTFKQVSEIRQKYPVFPSKNFGCSQLALQSDAKFYGCCESSKSIGSLSDPISKILLNYSTTYLNHPLCCDPNYFCDLKDINSK
ncbi:MAG: radical SAM protein [Candidatus Shapirobacteria bacterium]